ncbi:MAG: hypothetical protein JNM72_15525 [Deltaproteobacteria bacterium]|nr:hypothetical protein [Deltaproteobacteria bacterium]
MRSRSPALTFALTAAICALMTACAADDAPDKAGSGGEDTGAPLDPGPAYQPPGAAGPYLVGTYASAFTSRDGLELPVQIWYPVDPEDQGFLHEYDGLVTGAALNDATPRCDGLRPVALFSHGNGGVRFQSVFLTEHLASRGWIVVAPDHVGNTLFDLDDDRLEELIFRRPADIADAADWLFDIEAGSAGPLAGCVDPVAGYAVLGHSFGGFTALALTGGAWEAEAIAASCGAPGRDRWLCDQTLAGLEARGGQAEVADRRVWASVPMTPAGRDVLEPALARAVVPTLVIGGGRDTLTTIERQVEPLYAAVGGRPKALGLLADAGHYTFSDLCGWAPTYDDCFAPYLEPAVAHAVTNEAVDGFLDELRGVDAAAGSFPPAAAEATFTVER